MLLDEATAVIPEDCCNENHREDLASAMSSYSRDKQLGILAVRCRRLRFP